MELSMFTWLLNLRRFERFESHSWSYLRDITVEILRIIWQREFKLNEWLIWKDCIYPRAEFGSLQKLYVYKQGVFYFRIFCDDETVSSKSLLLNYCKKLKHNYLFLINLYATIIICLFSGDFTCPWNYFKCRNSYCIPEMHVCNGFTDCPNAEDEYACSMF